MSFNFAAVLGPAAGFTSQLQQSAVNALSRLQISEAFELTSPTEERACEYDHCSYELCSHDGGVWRWTRLADGAAFEVALVSIRWAEGAVRLGRGAWSSEHWPGLLATRPRRVGFLTRGEAKEEPRPENTGRGCDLVPNGVDNSPASQPSTRRQSYFFVLPSAFLACSAL